MRRFLSNYFDLLLCNEMETKMCAWTCAARDVSNGTSSFLSDDAMRQIYHAVSDIQLITEDISIWELVDDGTF